MGLRSLYFAMAPLIERFRYLKVSLVFLLGFVGAKILMHDHVDIPSGTTLGVIAGTIAIGAIASFVRPGGRSPRAGAGRRPAASAPVHRDRARRPLDRRRSAAHDSALRCRSTPSRFLEWTLERSISADSRLLAALALAASQLGACQAHVAPAQPAPEIAVHEAGGPPPHAPAHGYRRKQHIEQQDVELVFDSGLGVYVVVGFPGVYFHADHYFRYAGTSWQVSIRPDATGASRAAGGPRPAGRPTVAREAGEATPARSRARGAARLASSAASR